MTTSVRSPISTNPGQIAETSTSVKTRNRRIGTYLPNNITILQLLQNASHFPLYRPDNEIQVFALIFH